MKRLKHAIRSGGIIQLTGGTVFDREVVFKEHVDGSVLTVDCRGFTDVDELLPSLASDAFADTGGGGFETLSDIKPGWSVEKAIREMNDPVLFIQNTHELPGSARTTLAQHLKGLCEKTDAVIVVGTGEVKLLERANPDLAGRCYTHKCGGVDA